MPLDPAKIDRAAAKAGIPTRAALAAKLETTPQNLSRMLSGRHRVYLADAEKIAAAVRRPLAKLLAQKAPGDGCAGGAAGGRGS